VSIAGIFRGDVHYIGNSRFPFFKSQLNAGARSHISRLECFRSVNGRVSSMDPAGELAILPGSLVGWGGVSLPAMPLQPFKFPKVKVNKISTGGCFGF